MMRVSRIEKIVETSLLAINSGQETLDSILAKYPQEVDELRPRLEAALWMVNANKSLGPRPGFVASSRQYMEQRIALIPPRTFWQRLLILRTPFSRFVNLSAVVLLLVVFALVINSAVLTARLSIPGDPLYSAKLAVEDLQLAFTFNPERKLDLQIQFCRERTTEFIELVLNGDYVQLPAAADRMENNIISSLRSLNSISKRDPGYGLLKTARLSDALSSEILMLNVLRTTSPTSAHAGIDLAIEVAQSGVMALR